MYKNCRELAERRFSSAQKLKKRMKLSLRSKWSFPLVEAKNRAKEKQRNCEKILGIPILKNLKNRHSGACLLSLNHQTSLPAPSPPFLRLLILGTAAGLDTPADLGWHFVYLTEDEATVHDWFVTSMGFKLKWSR